MRFSKWVVVLGVVAISLAGCRSAVSPAFYTLNPILQSSGEIPMDGEHGTIVGIQPVELPGAIDRVQMVTRSGQHQLEVSDKHRWVDYPNHLIQQTLVENIQALMPGTDVVGAPWPIGFKPGITVTVKFQELIGAMDEEVTLNALWIVSGADPDTATFHRLHFTEAVEGSGYDALVNAYNQALAALSREMADSLKAMEK